MIAARFSPFSLVALLIGASPVLSAQSIASLTVGKPAAVCDVDVPVTVTLAVPAAQPVTVQFASSIPATLAAPAPVTIPAGQTATTVRFACVPTAQTLAVTLTASVGGTAATAVANVLAPALRSLSFKPDVRASADLPPLSFTGVIGLEGPAPASGAIVTLSASPADAATLPATVTVRGGERWVNVAVTNVRPVSAPQTITVTATAFGIARNASFTATPAGPRDLKVFDRRGTLQSSVTTGGNVNLDFRLALNDVAGPGGTPITITSSNPSLLAPPTGVRVPAGDSVVTFIARAGTTAANASTTVTAAVGTVSRSVQVALEAAQLGTLTIPALVGGAAGSGTVGLSGPAPSGGLVVSLSSSTPSLSVPPSVTVSAGQHIATFAVTTANVDQATSATVTASAGSARVTENTIVAAEGLSNFTLTPLDDGAGNTVTARLTAPKGHDGFTVALSASPASTITPASIRFEPNDTDKTVTLTFTPVAQPTPASVTARLAETLTATSASQLRTAQQSFTLGTTGTVTAVRIGVATHARSAAVTLLPPAVQRVSLSTTDTIGGTRGVITGTITLAGPAPARYVLRLTVSNPVAAIDQPPVFREGATTATFTVRTLAVNQPTDVWITASPNGPGQASVGLVLRPR